MTVIRNRHNAKNGWVALEKKVLWNENLSLRAIGLWGRCISRPDNWKFVINELINKCKEGRDSVYNAIKELIDERLCVRVQYYLTIRKDGKVYAGAGPIEYVFLEVPASEEEVLQIEKELRDEYEKQLRDSGLEFHIPKNSKKDYKIPENKDPYFKDPGNRTLTRTNIYIEKEKQQTQVVADSNEKEMALIPILEVIGLKGPEFGKLKKEFGIDELDKAIEILRQQTTIVEKPFPWLKKCLQEKWWKNEDKKSKILSNHRNIAQDVVKRISGKLKPGCSIECNEERILITRGRNSINIIFNNVGFYETLKTAIEQMGFEGIL